MSLELWHRNAFLYVKELAQCHETDLIFDYGFLNKKKFDIGKLGSYMDLQFGKGTDWRYIICGPQGSPLFESGRDEPVAVYKTWSAAYGNLNDLEAMMGGELTRSDLRHPDILQRAVDGQENRVIITDLPSAQTLFFKNMFLEIRDMSQDYPDCKIHIHGLYAFMNAIRMNFAAFDFESRSSAAKSKIVLPNNREVKKDLVHRHQRWLTILGFSRAQLEIPRERCMFNIKSVRWAADNMQKELNIQFDSARNDEADTEVSDVEFQPMQGGNWLTRRMPIQPGDRIECDTCSLTEACKYFQVGSVCTVPGSEVTPLAKQFQSRNSGDIIDGLSRIVAAGAARFEQSIKFEEDFGLDPEVTKQQKLVFDQAYRLAILIDPSLRPSAKVQVSIGGQPEPQRVQLTRANANGLIAEATQRLIEAGHKREDITKEMVQQEFERMGVVAIEGQVADE